MDIATALGLPESDVAVKVTLRIVYVCSEGTFAGVYGSTVVNAWSDADIDDVIRAGEDIMRGLASDSATQILARCPSFFPDVRAVYMGERPGSHAV